MPAAVLSLQDHKFPYLQYSSNPTRRRPLLSSIAESRAILDAQDAVYAQVPLSDSAQFHAAVCLLCVSKLKMLP